MDFELGRSKKIIKVLIYKITLSVLLLSPEVRGQWVSSSLGEKIAKSERYLFYLHGGVVTVLGDNAINQSVPEWGPYEYLNILDSLRIRGFNVISEKRKVRIDDSVYVNRIVTQIDTLLNSGENARNILVVGASAGSDIALRVSAKLRNDSMKFVIMGGCWPDTYNYYLDLQLHGHFLSIIELTDPHGTCAAIFNNRHAIKSVREITLQTGLSHGFIYKGYKEWIDPIVKWFDEVSLH